MGFSTVAALLDPTVAKVYPVSHMIGHESPYGVGFTINKTRRKDMVGILKEHIEDALKVLRDDAHRNSVVHGFWDEGNRTFIQDGCMGEEQCIVKTKPWNMGEKLALIHSELSELLEAHRKDLKESEKDISIIGSNGELRRITAIEEEVADVIIRVLDLSGKLEIDVGRVVVAKMEYNKGRPHMHGRKC